MQKTVKDKLEEIKKRLPYYDYMVDQMGLQLTKIANSPPPVIEYVESKWKASKWDIKPIEEFFEGRDLFRYRGMRLSPVERVLNMTKFVKNHLETVKANNGNEFYRPYLDRLLLIKSKIEQYEKK